MSVICLNGTVVGRPDTVNLKCHLDFCLLALLTPRNYNKNVHQRTSIHMMILFIVPKLIGFLPEISTQMCHITQTHRLPLTAIIAPLFCAQKFRSMMGINVEKKS